MILTCIYDNQGRIIKLVKGQENGSYTRQLPRGHNKGIVRKCPKELYSMGTKEIRQLCRVKDAVGELVELEYAKR